MLFIFLSLLASTPNSLSDKGGGSNNQKRLLCECIYYLHDQAAHEGLKQAQGCWTF